MMKYYPYETNVYTQLEYLYKRLQTATNNHMADRMVKIAALLDRDEFVGWQMEVPTRGMVTISLFGSESLQISDLEWISENLGKKKKKCNNKNIEENLTELYEFYLPVLEDRTKSNASYGMRSNWKNECKKKWPNAYFYQFDELIKAFRTEGAVFRAIFSSANEEEFENCQKKVLSSYDIGDVNMTVYMGKPVRARVFLLLPFKISLRLCSILEGSLSGVEIRYLGNIQNDNIKEIWNNPMNDSIILPELAAKVLALEPVVKETMLGVEVRDEEVKPIPASHKNSTSKKNVTIGKAITTAGDKRNITLADVDLRRHFQIVGQTGTGKSTLLSNMILSAIEKGYGLTFFDPHGTTIDVILHSLPEKYINRVRVVRIGDKENPVPLKIWDSPDPEKEEKNISQLCELFREIFDPNNQGFVGPRYERWLSTFAKASIALLKDAANFESICVLSQNQSNMLKLYKCIHRDYEELADIIRYEYGTDKSNEFVNYINWYLCKFQRLCSVQQLRDTLGAPVNALDFKNAIDTDMVTLIDLASPVIGTNASRIMGTLLLMKLWDAVQERKNTDMTHLVVIDEVSLFQTEPLPSMLSQARKFGLSLVLCHQHAGQLSSEICDALEANSANFCAFRLSPKDAYNASIRFDDEKMLSSLTRLNAFNAVTSISVNGKQTKPFTLQISLPKKQKNGNAIAEKVEENSRRTLVDPYRDKKALTRKEILNLLNKGSNEADMENAKAENEMPEEKSINGDKVRPQWVDKYLQNESA